MKRRDLLFCGAAAAIPLASAALDLRLNSISRSPALIAEFGARLGQVPAQIGDWVGEEAAIPERQQRVAGIDHYLRRNYQNIQNGYSVTLTLLSGASGPMAVHPPTACFQGVGYQVVREGLVRHFRMDSGDSISLNEARFRRGDQVVGEAARVFWGWSTDGFWQAPENPRLTFRHLPQLYKLYVTDRDIDRDDDETLPQAEMFLAEALPVFRSAFDADLSGEMS